MVDTTYSLLFLCRHGETFFNLENRLGGNALLTDKGKKDAQLVRQILFDHPLSKLYYSRLARSKQTSEIIMNGRDLVIGEVIETPLVNELYAGDMESMTYEEVEEKYPEMFREREKDKFHFRFPNGESYADGVARVRPLIDSFGTGSFLVVGHRGINRCILGYLLGLNEERFPHLNMPHDVVFRINLESREVWHIRGRDHYKGHVVH